MNNSASFARLAAATDAAAGTGTDATAVTDVMPSLALYPHIELLSCFSSWGAAGHAPRHWHSAARPGRRSPVRFPEHEPRPTGASGGHAGPAGSETLQSTVLMVLNISLSQPECPSRQRQYCQRGSESRVPRARRHVAGFAGLARRGPHPPLGSAPRARVGASARRAPPGPSAPRAGPCAASGAQLARRRSRPELRALCGGMSQAIGGPEHESLFEKAALAK